MEIPSCAQKEVTLAPYTSLRVGGSAQYFAEPQSVEALSEVIRFAKEQSFPMSVLAGGTNTLVSDEGFRGVIIHPQFFGFSYVTQGDNILLTLGASENLDACIQKTITENWWGLENLSAIPGTVGGVPVQNVGAYGVEVSDVTYSVSAFDCLNECVVTLMSENCRFGYRHSIFKEEPQRYCILSVTFTLSKHPTPNLSYKDLQTHFQNRPNPTLEEIRTAVCAIRAKKFPDMTRYGTAGSFFKNPIIPQKVYGDLVKEYPGLPGYPVTKDTIKVSLGWILDKVCMLKGFTEGNVALYEEQALVLVTNGNATATEIKNFSDRIAKIVFEKTKIVIEREVTNIE